MIPLSVDRAGPLPAWRQICERIVTLVDAGALRPGDRLPSSRTLATGAGVHRTTVVRAYAELAALGYVESRAGSYTTVRRRARLPATTHAVDRGSLLDWHRLATPGARAAAADALADASAHRSDDAPPGVRMTPESAPGDPGTIDFARLTADPDLAPGDDLRRCLKSVLVRSRGTALDYGEAAGHRPLRETIAARLRVHGIAAEPREVIVTAGAQQGMDLVLRLLCRPGDRVAVESPTYGMALALLRLHGVKPVGIPMREDGLDLGALERALAKRSLRLVYSMPNFQNPTGITTGQAHRERLLALCERYRVPLLEDGFEEEMKFFGQAVLPIKSMDANGVVLYLGTFSKVVFPGLRVGWIAAPAGAVDRLAAIQRAASLGGNTLAQAAAARFCAGGQFEAYLKRVHREYRGRMQDLLRALARHMPPGVTWTRPQGGCTLWLTLPLPATAEADLCERLLRSGVRVTPGCAFFARPPARAHLRLSVSCLTGERIDEGCARIARELVRATGRQRPAGNGGP